MKKNRNLLFFLITLGICFSDSNHLLFNRITLKPNNAEFVSIYNPTNESVNLSNYYITDSVIDDDNSYYNLPYGENYWASESPQRFTDFIARFPDVTINPNDSLVLSMKTDNLFYQYYSYTPDLSLFEDMLDLDENGTISCKDLDCPPDNFDFLNDNEEVLILFYWDGISNTVNDVDYFLWGGIDHAIDKTGIGDYLDDTPLNEQEFKDAHQNGYTFIRLDNDEGNESDSNGNGIFGNDETSENLIDTWGTISSPEFGCTDQSATNYDSNATIDDGSCNYAGSETTIDDIINNCGDGAGESLSCDGEYDLSSESASLCPLYEQSVTTTGVVVDYFDITPFNGPFSFTIQDLENGGRIDFVVWPESSEYQDGFNITQTDLSVLTQAPFGRYEVQITGNLGAYCDDDQLLDINNEWQVTVEYESDIVIIQEYDPNDLGCTDPDAANYNENAITDDGSCIYPEPGTEASIDDIINNCGSEAGESLSCNGEYELDYNSSSLCPLYEQQVTTTGIVIDYFDITPFNGPYSFTIQDLSGGGTIDFVVWPESSSYQDGFDITQTNLNVLTQPPFGRYEVQITGELGAYCDDDQLLNINNEWQVTVEYESSIDIIEIYSMEGIVEEDPSINYVEIKPEPYVLIPGLGETLDFSYKFPENSQIRIRIFDISGRFITSLATEHRENAATVYMNTGATAWDGRNNLGQIVSPGTYLIHIEAYNYSNGTTLRDVAPIVVGVGQ